MTFFFFFFFLKGLIFKKSLFEKLQYLKQDIRQILFAVKLNLLHFCDKKEAPDNIFPNNINQIFNYFKVTNN